MCSEARIQSMCYEPTIWYHMNSSLYTQNLNKKAFLNQFKLVLLNKSKNVMYVKVYVLKKIFSLIYTIFPQGKLPVFQNILKKLINLISRKRKKSNVQHFAHLVDAIQFEYLQKP